MQYDVAIIGAGPAGLSAAILLGRCRRSVIVFDHAKPRNYAAHTVNGYLGADRLSPSELRALGRKQATDFGVEFRNEEIKAAECGADGGFELSTDENKYSSRKLLLATGMQDHLPDIVGLEQFYGHSVHHCPYCDAYEHRDERLLALASGDAVAKLAMLLRGWSTQVTACCNGESPSLEKVEELKNHQVKLYHGRPTDFRGVGKKLTQVNFDDGSALECDAVFFSSSQAQRSPLPEMLGCKKVPKDQVKTGHKQQTGVSGLFLAGDADGEVQFAIVAASEGCVAATAINEELQVENWHGSLPRR